MENEEAASAESYTIQTLGGNEESQPAAATKLPAAPRASSTSSRRAKPDNSDGRPLRRPRYWSSWEEMQLCEVWLRNASAVAVSEIKRSGDPIFSEIARQMKLYNFTLTAQECRRRMLMYQNKYFAVNRSETEESTQWRLYPIVQKVMKFTAGEDTCEPMHEIKIVENLMQSLPADTEPPDAAPAAVTAAALNGTANVSKTADAAQRNPVQSKTTVNAVAAASAQPAPNTMPASNADITRRILLIRSRKNALVKRTFTNANLQQLRLDNVRLTEQRDEELKRLRLEEKEFKCLENYFLKWQLHQEQVLQRLQSANVA